MSASSTSSFDLTVSRFLSLGFDISQSGFFAMAGADIKIHPEILFTGEIYREIMKGQSRKHSTRTNWEDVD